MVTAIVLAFCCAVNPDGAISPALHARCLSVLREALADGKEFVKVHAAESLIWTGNAGNVREVFLNEPTTAPTEIVSMPRTERSRNGRATKGIAAISAAAIRTIVASQTGDGWRSASRPPSQ